MELNNNHLFEVYLRLINILQGTGQIVRENVNDTNKFLVIFKNIFFSDSSLNDLIDVESELQEKKKIKKIESYYLQAEKTLFVTLTL